MTQNPLSHPVPVLYQNAKVTKFTFLLGGKEALWTL